MTLQEFFRGYYPLVQAILDENHAEYKRQYFIMVDTYGYERTKEVTGGLYAIFQLLSFT